MPAPKKTSKKVAPDPEAVALAKRAQEHAKRCGLTSSYLWREAQEFTDLLTVEKKGAAITIAREGCEPVATKLAAIKAFAKTGEDKDLARALRPITSGTKLYARKCAVFCVVSVS